MAIQRPTAEQLQELASRLHISLTPAQAEEYLAVMQANFDAYDLIDSLPDDIPEVRYPRAAGYRPTGEENPLMIYLLRYLLKNAVMLSNGILSMRSYKSTWVASLTIRSSLG